MSTWEDFLASVLPDPAHREFTQRLIGYGYLAEPYEPICAVFQGTGPNGKTTLTRALETALGLPVFDNGDVPEFAPATFAIVVTNQLPRPFGKALVVPFPEQFTPPRRDTAMLAALRAPDAQDAIRSWAYGGYIDMARQGLNPPRGIVRLSP